MRPTARAPRSSAARAVIPSSFRYSWLVVALLAALVLLVRFRLRGIPLERDEGEFAYIGQLILEGIPPYSLAYSMKLPGIYLAYALILSVFGPSVGGVHLGFAAVNVAAIALIFMLCRRLFDDGSGMVAAAAYAVMTLSPSLLGTSAHATHFVVLAALGGLLLLVHALGIGAGGENAGPPADGKGTYAAIAGAGALLGIAFLMKQPGVLFVVCGVAWILVLSRSRVRAAIARMVALLAGAAVPVGLVGLWLAAAGVFGTFWFWVFTYARAYASAVPIRDAGSTFMASFAPIVQAAPLIWMLAAAGVILPLWNRASRSRVLLLLILALCSAVAASLTFYYRPHYFVLALPAVAMLAGVTTSGLMRLLNQVTGSRIAALLSLSLAALAIIMPLRRERSFLFEISPDVASRLMYGNNPFPESAPIADYIKRHSEPTDRVAIIGSEPQIYFHADRLSATGYIYTYGLMEDHPHALEMQRQMIREVEAARPRFVVFVMVATSWLRRPTSKREIFDWATKYVQSGHRLVGWIDLPSEESGEARYYWDRDASEHRGQARDRVLVYERER